LVCISHVGIDDSSDPTSITVAKFVPQIDVIIDGHSHSTLADIEKKNTTSTLITSTGSYGAGLGVVDIVVGPDRKVISKTARTITPKNSPDLKANPSIAKVLDDLVKAQDAVLSQVVGRTEIKLEGTREIVRTQQSNLGTLIANSMLYATGADFALMNGGGIRDSIPVGDITMKQIYTVQPFGNLSRLASPGQGDRCDTRERCWQATCSGWSLPACSQSHLYTRCLETRRRSSFQYHDRG